MNCNISNTSSEYSHYKANYKLIFEELAKKNPKLAVGANGLENLAEVCKGKVCVDLDLDRQKFPFWRPEDIDRHVKEAVDILGAPEGGLWLKAEIADDVPLENVEAICSALERYSNYYTTEQNPEVPFE